MADWVLKISDHSICMFLLVLIKMSDFLFVGMVDHYTFLVDVSHAWMGV